MLMIDWKKTAEKLRQTGFTEEEIDGIRKDPVTRIARFLDKERGLSIYFRGKGLIFEINGEMAFDVSLKQRQGTWRKLL